ncbi:acyl carrier protein [Breoghania sp. L-A4]|uniref:acyl carrier protein n=1 Tax=Breoghania sp. L-A4 TaxID=2304600 RepID=UPI000E359781|nr:acyl carrier protein [Breoghania sp. L-A4]AXS39710.1 acyl carrier protein [Breoghania sp. L-A4]
MTLSTELLEFLRQQIAQRTKLNIEDISEDSVLMDLGLQSIDAVLLCGDVEDRFQVEMDPADIFDHETLGAFAKSILQRLAD